MWWSRVSTFWRALSKSNQFVEGGRFNVADYNYVPFKNNYQKLVEMFMIRRYHVNNTPYQIVKDKYNHELTVLHKELNFLHARLFMTRGSLVIISIILYMTLIQEEESRDWGDSFDYKFMVKAYGELEDSSGEGNTGIDDWTIYHNLIIICNLVTSPLMLSVEESPIIYTGLNYLSLLNNLLITTFYIFTNHPQSIATWTLSPCMWASSTRALLHSESWFWLLLRYWRVGASCGVMLRPSELRRASKRSSG